MSPGGRTCRVEDISGHAPRLGSSLGRREAGRLWWRTARQTPYDPAVAKPHPIHAREASIRSALRAVVLSSSACQSARVVEEFWTPMSNERADLVVVGDHLAAYEIKSAADTLRRLPRQVAAFSRLFDRCTAVVATKHEERTIELLPDWWGLLVVPPGLQPRVSVRRAAHQNPTVEIELVVRLLWRDEVARALRDNGVEPDLRGGRTAMWSQLLQAIDAGAIQGVVRRALSAREHWRGQRGNARLSPVPATAR